jgi:hypothetical protein
VDCSGATPGWYTSINSVLAVATNGSWIYVKSGTTCTENVMVSHMTNVAIAADWLQTANLVGSLSIQSSRSIDIQGLNVSGSTSDGINVSHSSDVAIDSCSATNNASAGLNVNNASDVTIGTTGTFDYNGLEGIVVSGNSFLQIVAWGAPIDISYNKHAGINADRSVVFNLGNTTINNNQMSSGLFPTGFGIQGLGGAKIGVFGILGPVTMTSNQGGAIGLIETSEVSVGGNISWAPYLVTLQGNGPVGIDARYGSQVTVFGGTEIADHTGVAVDLYGNSEADIFGANQITHNGYGNDPDGAGIRVDSNSQVYLRSAVITRNGGPGVLGLVGSTLDVAGSTFSANAGGAIACDSSANLTTDLPSSVLGPANSCKVSHGFRNHGHDGANFHVPDWRGAKAHGVKMHAMNATLRH